MNWLDVHAGSVQAFATLVLVVITAYYAWTSRGQVQAMRSSLQANARLTLQNRLDRVSELMLSNPEVFQRLDDTAATGDEKDERFHLTNILVGVLEEAYIQHHIEHSMPVEEWRAWESTFEGIMQHHFVRRYWQLSRNGFGESFARYVDSRMAATQKGQAS